MRSCTLDPGVADHLQNPAASLKSNAFQAIPRPHRHSPARRHGFRLQGDDPQYRGSGHHGQGRDCRAGFGRRRAHTRRPEPVRLCTGGRARHEPQEGRGRYRQGGRYPWRDRRKPVTRGAEAGPSLRRKPGTQARAVNARPRTRAGTCRPRLRHKGHTRSSPACRGPRPGRACTPVGGRSGSEKPPRGLRHSRAHLGPDRAAPD